MDLVRRVTEINEKNLSGVKSDLEKQVKTLEENVGAFKEENKLLQEGLLNIPPDVKNSDPLTPLDQEYVTLDDLQSHYRLFINRVQQQLATFGGGGARIMSDLEDVDVGAGVQTNGWVLAYNTTYSVWEPKAGGSAGAGGTWASNNVGVHTLKNVGIGTTARSGYNLYVGAGNTTDDVAYFDGNITVAGTAHYEDVVNQDAFGFSTFRSGLNVKTGSATTALLVEGDTRITGILTIGTSSVEIDGD